MFFFFSSVKLDNYFLFRVFIIQLKSVFILLYVSAMDEVFSNNHNNNIIYCKKKYNFSCKLKCANRARMIHRIMALVEFLAQ